jgi:threonine dehydrogenase-like Zn-dependent dehydrogenase
VEADGIKGNIARHPRRVRNIDYPTYEMKDGPGLNKANVGRRTPHGAILKNVATNICGSDQHMVRGRTTAPEGLVLGHEITGEAVETGPDADLIKVGDLCSVPFNISCGRCRNCKERKPVSGTRPQLTDAASLPPEAAPRAASRSQIRQRIGPFNCQSPTDHASIL